MEGGRDWMWMWWEGGREGMQGGGQEGKEGARGRKGPKTKRGGMLLAGLSAAACRAG